MAWTVELTAAAEDDLDHAFDHFYLAQIDFGANAREAFAKASERIAKSFDAAQRLAKVPRIGTRHDDIAQGLRHVTLDGAILWFTPEAETRTVRVEAIFHRGQDHFRRILERLGEGGDD